jgi:membrane glycosyltransferase
LLGGVLGEVVFSTLLAPIMALAHTVFMIGLLFGQAIVWSPQRRETHRVPFALALRRLWPQSLFGGAGAAWLASAQSTAAVLVSPFLLGAVLAIPIAMVTASPRLGRALARIGAWRIPEEVDPPGLIQGLGAMSPGRAPTGRLAALQPATVDAIGGDAPR